MSKEFDESVFNMIKSTCQVKMKTHVVINVDIDDYIQEVSVQVYKKLNDNIYDESKSSLNTFISLLAENALKNLIRSSMAIKNSMYTLEVDSKNDETDTEVYYDKPYEEDFSNVIVQDVVKKLHLKSNEQQVLIKLLEGYTRTEVAQMCGVGRSRITAICNSIQDKYKKKIGGVI